PAASDRAAETIAHAIFQRQLLRPTVETHGFEHPHGFCHRERSKSQPRHHGAGSGIFLAHFDILIPPSLRQTLVQEHSLAFLDYAPVVPPNRKQKCTKNTKLAKLVCYFMKAIQNILRCVELVE